MLNIYSYYKTYREDLKKNLNLEECFEYTIIVTQWKFIKTEGIQSYICALYSCDIIS